MNFEFLTIEDALEIHAMQLARYGGGKGIRDRGLLESALAQPQMTFDGEYVHEGIFAMAAAYLFHIVSNHPFLDGNKRAGLLCALVFLDLNGITTVRNSESLYDLTMTLAAGRAGKSEVAAALERIASLH
ncbi:MAG: type II toxin-antitoxin system death-on-curing family toxin [Deltaproteobacteria bacterium]|nr:type II toxin-antitoxin system death-on-curing family toxin [Deltaproteobacteria bacterium]